MHISIANFSQMVTDRENIAIADKGRMRAFRLPDLNLTVAYFKGQLHSWNGMLQICWHSCSNAV